MRVYSIIISLFFMTTVVAQDYTVPKGRKFKSHTAYKFEFDVSRQISKWVGYTLKKEDVTGNKTIQLEYKKDPLEAMCPKPGDYYKSGYAYCQYRARSDARSSDTLMKEVNYLTNVAPMDASLKQGNWRILNNLIRGWAVTFDSIHVVSGPIFDQEKTKTLGKKKINVPDKFFKAVLVYNGMDMGCIGFIIPNLPNAKKLGKYSMSIDSLEHYTNLDFFSDLPDYVEFYLEEKIDPIIWKDQSNSYLLKSHFIEKKRCIAALPNEARCTIKTTCVTQQCWKHGCDVKEARKEEEE